jgi:hypothetical protein
LGMHRRLILGPTASTALPAITCQPPEAPTPSPNPVPSPSRASMLSRPPTANRQHLSLTPNSRLNSSPPPPKVSLCPSKS